MSHPCHYAILSTICTRLLQVLDNESRGTTATVANADGTNLGLLLLENRGEGGDDTSTRAAERVANSNGTTVDVDLVGVEAENLHVGKSNDRESLVNLVEFDLVRGQAGVLDSFGNGKSRSNSESLRLALGVTPAENSGNRLEVELLELSLGDKDDGGGAIVDGGGVGGGDTTVWLESRAHGLELGLVEVLDLVVALDLDWGLAAATADLNGNNLGEQTSLSGGLGLFVRVDSVLVLSLTGELVVLSAKLTGKTHVLLLVRVGEAVLQDTVDEGLVAVLGAGSKDREVVGSVGHGFGTASNDDVRSAEHDVLGAENNGLERRGADLVHGGADGRLRKAGTDGALSSRSLTKTTDDRC